MKPYLRFAGMIAVGVVAMYCVMYLNVFRVDHIYWSETRAYMALIMGATMVLVMLPFMLGMYRNTALNIAIVAASVIVFAGSLYLVRSQRTIEDIAWMKAMIPHHSIAILTSERARISDPRVRDLANRIIDSQRREIDEMKGLIRDLESGNTTPTGQAAPAS